MRQWMPGEIIDRAPELTASTRRPNRPGTEPRAQRATHPSLLDHRVDTIERAASAPPEGPHPWAGSVIIRSRGLIPLVVLADHDVMAA